ncbi:MAG: hypothetical protein ABI224_16770 [Acetobacteraceae bacterium]
MIRVRDRLGWRLKPLVVMQGAKNRLWPHPADALVSTRLLKPAEARAAIAAVTVPGDLP